MNHVDIRKHGSGNAGTTNALRTLGWKAGVITFVGDCLKCVLAVVIVRLIFADNGHVELLAFYAGLGAVLGHNFPFYLNFKGGKGIASTAGLILAVNPVMFLIVAIVFIAIVYIRNEFYYINPFLNLIGYSFYKVTYMEEDSNEIKETNIFYKGKIELNTYYKVYHKRKNLSFLSKK